MQATFHLHPQHLVLTDKVFFVRDDYLVQYELRKNYFQTPPLRFFVLKHIIHFTIPLKNTYLSCKATNFVIHFNPKTNYRKIIN